MMDLIPFDRNIRPRLIRRLSLTLVIATFWGFDKLAVAVEAPVESSFSEADIEFFEKQVRPILANRCGECHGGSASPKGGLRLDSRAAVLAGGDTGPAVVPKDLTKSLLIDAINYGETYQMPPKGRLPPAEIAVLTRWVELGAPWPKEAAPAGTAKPDFNLAERKQSHWVWKPLARQPLPEVADAAGLEQFSDAFIRAKLAEANLASAGRADASRLSRRIHFDLLGLPPEPERSVAFERDERPDAWDRLVDQLLANPHFGERWGRHWLDLMRYAETCGHEFDYPIRNAWYYRDYVVRAFNTDLPYNQFVVEHIAGDLVSSPRRHPTEGYDESILGTTSWYLGEAIHAPVDSRGDLANRMDNQVDVFSKTFLGMTVACARCHEHKFDAVSQRDYYSLLGFLRSSRRQEAMLDPHGRIASSAQQLRDLKSDADRKMAGALPRPESSSAGEVRALLRAVVEIAAAPGQPESERIAAAAQRHQLAPERLGRTWTALRQDWIRQPRYHVSLLAGALEPNVRVDEYLARETRAAQDAAARDATQVERYPPLADFSGPGWSGWTASGEAFGQGPITGAVWNAISETPQFAPPGVAHSGLHGRKLQGVLRSPSFTIEHPHIFYRLAGEGAEIRLIVDGYTMIEFHQLLFGGLKFDVNTQGQFGWHHQSGDLRKYIGHRAHIELIDHGAGYVAVDEIRFSTDGSAPPTSNAIRAEVLSAKPTNLEQLAEAYAQRWEQVLRHAADGTLSADEAEWLNWGLEQGWVRWTEIEGRAPADWLAAQAAKLGELDQRVPDPIRVPAMIDGPGENEHIYIRGNHRLLGEEAPRQMLEALVGQQPVRSPGSGRQELAQAVIAPQNPLTARVMVNRIWQHLFGRGIVASVDNFGVLGDPPSHPELLDALALRFVEDDWSVKRSIRSLLLSATYRLASAETAAGRERDPTNRYWHRALLRRLEGEAIRDAMLAISGRFDGRFGGPSVPVHITPFMQGRGRPGQSGPLDGQGRRTLYTEVRRNFLSPMMLAFDAPIPFTTIGRRNESNVPAQALILLNDPFVVEQSRQWARGLLSRGESLEQIVHRVYRQACSRSPSAAEISSAREFFATQGQEYGLAAEQAVRDERVWADYCHVLWNVKEFIFLD